MRYSSSLTQEQKNALGPIHKLPCYHDFVEEGKKIKEYLKIHNEASSSVADRKMTVFAL